MSHLLPYFTKRNQRPTSHTQLKKQLLHKDVSIQRRRKPCCGREIHVPKRIWKLSPKSKSAREVRRRHPSCILSFDLIGQHQNKRFYVMEIVLPLGFADAIFWEGEKRQPEMRLLFAGQLVWGYAHEFQHMTLCVFPEWMALGAFHYPGLR